MLHTPSPRRRAADTAPCSGGAAEQKQASSAKRRPSAGAVDMGWRSKPWPPPLYTTLSLRGVKAFFPIGLPNSVFWVLAGGSCTRDGAMLPGQ
ncbi:hypothetical protein CCHR01_13427 [Colletotrichum chrysophilum]|uniref:Uncharacterized protein n=1 Tax=Colletotrichum chrysophilum TaxID=1836956 RepID=A0AAD9A9G4_9PEZI|nr:hypothetical protein CCHR01_13427 [Colletotrichum chrysophilum]